MRPLLLLTRLLCARSRRRSRILPLDERDQSRLAAHRAALAARAQIKVA